jgi:hypothetical protein
MNVSTDWRHDGVPDRGLGDDAFSAGRRKYSLRRRRCRTSEVRRATPVAYLCHELPIGAFIKRGPEGWGSALGVGDAFGVALGELKRVHDDDEGHGRP